MCDGRRERRLLVRELREYQAARKLPKGEPKSEAWKARRAAFGAVRQRRANNPDAFNPNGTAKSGKRKW